MKLKLPSLTLLLLLTQLIACSDSTDGNTTTQNDTATTVGVVNSINSASHVNVSGTRFDISNAEVTLEDAESLDVGMMVSVEGSVDDANNTGVAYHIKHESEIKGVVIANDVTTSASLNVMGITVNVDDMTVYVSEYPNYPTLESIPANALVEVSGFVHTDGSLKASRIELEAVEYQADMMLKIKGEISAIGDGYFMMGGLTVMYNENTVFMHMNPEQIMVGMVVKVKSQQAFDSTAMNLLADYIHLKKHGVDKEDGDKVALYGEVTSDAVLDNLFYLNDQAVLVTVHTKFKYGSVADIVKGVMLKAKGRMNADDVLVADKIEFKQPDKIKIMGPVDEVNTEEHYLLLMGSKIFVNDMTWFKDHPHYSDTHPQNPGTEPPVTEPPPEEVPPVDDGGTTTMVVEDMKVNPGFDLADIMPGNFLKVDAYTNKMGQRVASKVERKKPEHPAEHKVVGPVTAIDLEANTIEIAGVAVDVSLVPNLMVAVGDKAAAVGEYDAENRILRAKAAESEPVEEVNPL